MLMLKSEVVAVVQLVEQVGDRGGGRADRAHRHRVDQQAHHRIGSGQLGRAARHRGAEDDVLLTGQRHQQLRPAGLQHRVHRRVVTAGQVDQLGSGLCRQCAGRNAAPAGPHPPRWANQGGCVEAGQHFPPGPDSGVDISFGQPGDEPAVRCCGREALAVVAGEDLLRQDRQRPAVQHDVVIRQDAPVFVLRGADQGDPKCRRFVQSADRRPLSGANPLDFRLIGDLAISPRGGGFGGNDLDRFVEQPTEPGDQVGVPDDDGADGRAQSIGVQRSGNGQVQLHCIHVVGVAVGRAGVEQQSLLQWCERQDVDDRVLPAQRVNLWLAQPSGRDIRGGQPATTAAYVCTDAGQRLEPQPAQAADLFAGQRRDRPGPGGLQARPGVGVEGGGAQFDGVPQRH
ncbi:hypothetical protein MYSI104531_27310 [Mycobacterium simiae]